jgi:hypothetical protein
MARKSLFQDRAIDTFNSSFTTFCQLAPMRKAVFLLLMALAVPARAADDTAPDAKKGGKPGTNVEMPFLMAPLTNADGKLVGYAYLSTRLTATSDTYALAVRDKLPFIQDAMVRDVNAEAVAGLDDPEKVDIAEIEKRLLADAVRVMGAGKVRLMTVCTVQIAELHPAQPEAPNTPADQMTAGGVPSKSPIKSRCES